MKFAAVIMAGGKGTRMRKLGEKSLVRIGGTEMFKRVASAVKGSRYIEEVTLTSTHHTPNTTKEAASFGLRVVTTPGFGYIEDLRYAVNSMMVEALLVINADLPFITTGIIDKVCNHYVKAQKPALTVMTRVEKIRELGFEPSFTEHGLSPVGMNVVRGPLIGEDEMGQEILVLEEALSLININTPGDVQRAESLLKLFEAKTKG